MVDGKMILKGAETATQFVCRSFVIKKYHPCTSLASYWPIAAPRSLICQIDGRPFGLSRPTRLLVPLGLSLP